MAILESVNPEIQYRFCEYNQPITSKNFRNIEHRLFAPNNNQFWIFYYKWQIVDNGSNKILVIYPFSVIVDGVVIIFGNPDYPTIPVCNITITQPGYIGIQYEYTTKSSDLVYAKIVYSDSIDDLDLLIAEITEDYQIKYQTESNIHWKINYFTKIALVDGNTYSGIHDFSNAEIKIKSLKINVTDSQEFQLINEDTDDIYFSVNGNILSCKNLDLEKATFSSIGNVNPSLNCFHFIGKDIDYFVFENAKVYFDQEVYFEEAKLKKLVITDKTGQDYSDYNFVIDFTTDVNLLVKTQNMSITYEFETLTNKVKFVVNDAFFNISANKINIYSDILTFPNHNQQIRIGEDDTLNFVLDPYTINIKHRQIILDDKAVLNTQFEEPFNHYLYGKTYIENEETETIKIKKELILDSNCKITLLQSSFKVPQIETDILKVNSLQQLDTDADNYFAGRVTFKNNCIFENDVLFKNPVVMTQLIYGVFLPASNILDDGMPVSIDENGQLVPFTDPTSQVFIGITASDANVYETYSNLVDSQFVAIQGIVKINKDYVVIQDKKVYVANKLIGIMINDDYMLIIR